MKTFVLVLYQSHVGYGTCSEGSLVTVEAENEERAFAKLELIPVMQNGRLVAEVDSAVIPSTFSEGFPVVAILREYVSPPLVDGPLGKLSDYQCRVGRFLKPE